MQVLLIHAGEHLLEGVQRRINGTYRFSEIFTKLQGPTIFAIIILRF